MAAALRAVRRLTPGILWRQWITVLIGIGVIAASVAVAENARTDSARHWRVAVLAERVRVASQALDSVMWQALADAAAAHTVRLADAPALVRVGFEHWAALAGSLHALSSAGVGDEIGTLDRDAEALFATGTRTLTRMVSDRYRITSPQVADQVRAALDKLDADSARAAAIEEQNATGASSRAGVAYAGSIVLGSVLLLLLGWRLQRMHRRAELANERREFERRSEKALEDELRHQAFHDSLTGLPNRALFEDRLGQALSSASRHGRRVAVLFVDLDDFKTINDSLGHTSGDELLRTVATRIAGVVRANDTAARFGGDEFAVLLELGDEHDAELMAARILDALGAPCRIHDLNLAVNASVGLAVDDGSLRVDEMLRNADTAMYAAKHGGKRTVQRFEVGMQSRVVERRTLAPAAQ